MSLSNRLLRRLRPSSFTLVELLTVIAIIAILIGITLYAASAVMRNAARSRARGEIAAISAALENYKSDNGSYPLPANSYFTGTNQYTTLLPPTVSGAGYEGSSSFLYQSLTGQTNYGDAPPTGSTGARAYLSFSKSELGNNTSSSGNPIYIQDPFGYSYGYYSTNSTTTTVNPNNGAGMFDLWSTAGDIIGNNTPSWINNWGGG